MAEPYIVLPDEVDQNRIHRDLIYPMKTNPDLRGMFPLLELLLKRYEVDSFIAGCSEVHMLAKHFLASRKQPSFYRAVDPLDILAREWAEKGKKAIQPWFAYTAGHLHEEAAQL